MNRGSIIQKFFEAYPGAEVYDNQDEMRERLDTMRECVVELRIQAIMNKSVKELQEAQSLEHDLSIVLMIAQQRYQARMTLVNGGGPHPIRQ